MPLLPGYFCGPTKFSRDKRIVIGHQRSLIVPKQAADDSSPGAQFRIRGSSLCSAIRSVRIPHRSEKLRLTEETARLEFAPVRVLRLQP
jgi:hypothetical protein